MESSGSQYKPEAPVTSHLAKEADLQHFAHGHKYAGLEGFRTVKQ